MAEGSAGGAGKLALGTAVGFALYYLLSSLGFGGGRGTGRGGDLAPGETPTPVSPPVPAPPVSPTPRPRDEQRLSFVMTAPTQQNLPASFALRGEPSRAYSIDELIARVKEGGRSDVTLRVRGDVLQGAVIAAQAAIRRAGLELWDEESSAPRVGNARGYYGARGRWS